jgi:hypothetical protein
VSSPDQVTQESDARFSRAPVESGRSPAPPAAVEFHIEELVLRGFAPKDRFRIADAIEGELRRLIIQGGLPAMAGSPASIERLDAGGFPLVAGDGPDRVGFGVARKIYARLSPPPPNPSTQKSTTRKRVHR